MPQMTGVFRVRKGQAGNEVAYEAIPNAVILFTNTVTGKEGLKTESSATGAFNFTIPAGKYVVSAYLKGGVTAMVTIGGQSGWEVLASSPKTAFQDFIDNPDAGEVDGALLDQFKRLAEQSTQGAIDSQKSAEQSLANSKAAIDRMDNFGMGPNAKIISETGVLSAFSGIRESGEYFIPRAITSTFTDLPEGWPSADAFLEVQNTGNKYSCKQKLVAFGTAWNRYKWERQVMSNGASATEWILDPLSASQNNGFYKFSKTVGVSNPVFQNLTNSYSYVTGIIAGEVDMYPERRGASYIQTQTHSTSSTLYNTIDWTQATGSLEKYRIQMVNGVWQQPAQYAMNRFGDQSFTPWRATDLPTKMTGWYAMNGDKVLLSSRVGQALDSLPQTYKDDWGIVVDGENISIPNWFHVDGRGYHPRASLNVGGKVEDAMERITGAFWHKSAGSSSSGVPVYSTSGAFRPNLTNVQRWELTRINAGAGELMDTGVIMDTAMSNKTANETRGMSIGLLPIIYLGV